VDLRSAILESDMTQPCCERVRSFKSGIRCNDPKRGASFSTVCFWQLKLRRHTVNKVAWQVGLTFIRFHALGLTRPTRLLFYKPKGALGKQIIRVLARREPPTLQCSFCEGPELANEGKFVEVRHLDRRAGRPPLPVTAWHETFGRNEAAFLPLPEVPRSPCPRVNCFCCDTVRFCPGDGLKRSPSQRARPAMSPVVY